MDKSLDETYHHNIKEALKDFDASMIELTPEEKARFIINRASEEASKYTDYILGEKPV